MKERRATRRQLFQRISRRYFRNTSCRMLQNYTKCRILDEIRQAAHPQFSCASCHQRALKSTETSDILIPGIATCQKCHAPGAGYAESRCFECHTYHDWEKRKEIKPSFTLPALQMSGR